MKRLGRATGIAVVAVAAISLIAACSSGKGSTSTSSSGASGSSSSGAATSGYNAATTGFANPSTKTGGTLNLAASADCDSWDPVNTYYGWCWNMQRLFTRSLVGYSSLPGASNASAISPDLATALGTHNADFTQWTYKLKTGLKWEDGTPITSAQIKYGIERNFALDVFKNGPSSYYLCTVDKCDSDGNPEYQGPYKSTTGLTDITTPDDNTIVFNLEQAFPDWDYIMALPASAPVKLTEGGTGFTGAKYTLHPLSDGPFKVDSYTPGQGITFVRNDQWTQASDTIRKPLVNKVVLTINANSDANDQALQAGTADIEPDIGVNPTFQAQIIADPNLKKNADDPTTGYTRYLAVYPSTIPNLDCREAIFYAINKSDLVKARGGTYGGEVGPTMANPAVPGYDSTANPYPDGADNTGDLVKAKAELVKCGKPDGFSTKMAYQTSGKSPAVFAAVQQALARVGITVTGLPHDPSGYYGGFIGAPATVVAQGIGIAGAGWSSDYPTGGGFWNSIAAGNAPPGGGNYTQIKDAKVDDLLKQASVKGGVNADLFKQLDAQVMSLAVNLPYVYDKQLNYRNPRLTNVRSNYGIGAYYDVVNIGTSDGK